MALTKFDRLRYRRNPLQFFDEVLGIAKNTLQWSLNPEYNDVYTKDGEYTDAWDGTPDPIIKILEELKEKPNKKDQLNVGVEAGTGLGKTFTAAAIVLWFLAVYGGYGESCQVITFAPTEAGLKNLLWKEIGRLWPEFKKKFPRAELQASLRIWMDPDIADWTAFGLPVGVAADEQSATKAQGHHAIHQLIILEECPGISMAVIEAAINTNSDDHNMILAIGNPDNQSDGLHQLCSMISTKHIRMSSYDHPNIVCQKSVIPGGPSQSKIDQRRARYGEEHPLFMSRVRGICPDVSELGLFHNIDLMAAKSELIDPLEERDVPGRHSHGWIRVYSKVNHSHLNRYMIFGDVAGDSGKGDWHAAIVLDRLEKTPAAIIRMRGPREDYVTALLAIADEYKVIWGQATRNTYQVTYWWPLLSWERVGVGALIMDNRIKGYPNLYRKRNLDVLDPSLQQTVGWDTTGKSRKNMIDELEAWGYELRNHPGRMRDREVYKEAAHFVWVPRGRSGRYEAQSGTDENGDPFHDDIMMALGGALVIDKVIPAPTVQPDVPKEAPKIQDEYFLRAISYRSNHTGGDSWIENFNNDPWANAKLPSYG